GKTSGKSGKSALDGDGKSHEEKQVEEKTDKELEGGASKMAGSNVDELIANVIKEEQSKHEETLKASELKSQQLEGTFVKDNLSSHHNGSTSVPCVRDVTVICASGKIKMLKEDRDAQKNDMLKLQIQISCLQRKLSNLSELCEKKDQIEALKKKQNSVKSGPAGRPLTANRKEITTPQNKVEVSTPPAEQGSQEKLYLEKLQAEEKKTQELIEQIRALQQQDRDAVKDEKSQLEDQAAALQAKLQNMSEQCQLKEQALQQKVAQMESERHYCELKIKELVMANEQKVKNIESENQKTELSYTAEVQDQLPHAVEEERKLYLKKLRDEEKKTQELEGTLLIL
ncbi:hypothetical protein JZ751_012935, partial [Albula glossodonta]